MKLFEIHRYHDVDYDNQNGPETDGYKKKKKTVLWMFDKEWKSIV